MTTVIQLAAAKERREATEQDAWHAYLAARSKAESSQDIRDGIAAGKAWSRWLSLFERRSA